MKFKSLSVAFLFLLCPITFADSTGPKDPGTAQALSGQNVVPWGNAQLSRFEDGSYALAFNSTLFSQFTNVLLVTNFGFNIPSDAVIEGVVVGVRRSAVGNVTISAIGLAGVFAFDKSDEALWPASFEYKDYGSPTDLWGASLTPALVNGSGFGASLTAQLAAPSGSTIEARVDHIRMTIYYTVSRTMPRRSILVSQSRTSREVKGR